jgi:glyoxylase-like metal-dependent hydrolase (beta-lactamase superfamily II)
MVTENVYAIVGSLGNRSPENLGNNATFGFVVTPKGVVLIDSGGTYKGAMKIHDVIKGVTDQPIAVVINTGGQDHRWLGNDYFKKQGARLIASARAVEDQKARTRDQFARLGNTAGDEALIGTNAAYADELFESEMQLVLGEMVLELRHVGQAHTPGDSFVWLPKEQVMFTGDIVYTERMLSIGEPSNSKSWVASFEAMAAFNPKHVVPGHGHATSLDRARADTYDYLTSLRESVSAFIEEGGDISEIRKIDQSKFNYLLNYDTLAGRNAQKVFTELEWE